MSEPEPNPESPVVAPRINPDIGTMPQEDVPAANRYIIRQQLNNLRDGKRRLVDAKQQLWQAVQSQEVKDAFGVDYPRLVQAIQDV